MEPTNAEKVLNYLDSYGIPREYVGQLELLKIAYGDKFQGKPLSKVSSGQAYRTVCHLRSTAERAIEKYHQELNEEMQKPFAKESLERQVEEEQWRLQQAKEEFPLTEYHVPLGGN